MSALQNKLFDEILQARQRVYAVGEPTPLQQLRLPGVDALVFAKREDLGPIKAYKWRGAYNCMAKLSPEARARGVVAASAGNHGQGVALAAARLGCKARIFMPRSTPAVKQNAVKMNQEIVVFIADFFLGELVVERGICRFGDRSVADHTIHCLHKKHLKAR